MIFNVMTLFPESFNDFLSTSIIGRSIKNDIIKVNLYNIRDYSLDKNKRVDDSAARLPGGQRLPPAEQDQYLEASSLLPGRIRKTSPSPQGRGDQRRKALALRGRSDRAFL